MEELNEKLNQEIVFEDYGNYDFFCLYELGRPNSLFTQPVLLRLKHPIISNNNLAGQDLAETMMEFKRDEMLKRTMKELKSPWLRLIGFCDASPGGDAPKGDELYSERGASTLTFYSVKTHYYPPWLIISQAASEIAFYEMIEEDCESEWACMGPIYPPTKWEALYYTEKDFSLSNEAAKMPCIQFIKKAKNSPVFTMNYLFFQTFLKEGWQFKKVYELMDLTQEGELRVHYERERVPLQSTLSVLFDAQRGHLTLTLTSAKEDPPRKKVELGFDCSDTDSLKKLLKHIMYYQEFIEFDNYHKFLIEIMDNGITAYWEVQGQPMEKIRSEQLPDERYEQDID